MPQHDVAAHPDLFGTESEGDRLYGEGLVHAGREVERSDQYVRVSRHGRTLTSDPGSQNRTLMNAPVSRKPTRR
ncbi:hypothetical protein Sviol_69730 [Streptomyces violascens]|uniref:Uncharacterized protein n=1 Tax=Streptomyces violascens TaxID=67381 RepID=A0ABQ3QZ60_9ACTN|nr:hypothetical protein Sviol_69730 [Streptomyces violascens]